MRSLKRIKVVSYLAGSLIAAIAVADGPVTRLQVTSPAGGETWTAGTTVAITWTSYEPAGYVDIGLERAGQPWAAIGYARTSDNEAEWEICPAIGDASDYRIRLVGRDRLGNPVETVSEPFAISGSAPRPSITIIQPTGGETWAADSLQTIQWTSTDAIHNVYVDLLKGGEFVRTIGYLPTSTGEVPWKLCSALPDGNDHTIRVFMDACGSGIEAESPAFSITGSVRPTLALGRPFGGEAWTAGTTERIEWTSTDAPGDLSIDLLKAGRWYAHVGNTPVNMDFFDWAICPTLGDGGDYQVRITTTDLCGGVVQTTSGSLAVTGSAAGGVPQVIRPVSGEVWSPGATESIQWSAHGAAGTAVIGLLAADGWRSTLALTDVAAEGFDWTVPPEYPVDPSATERLQIGVFVPGCGRAVGDLSGRFAVGDGPPRLPVDLDSDNDVDVRDFAYLQACFCGPDEVPIGRFCLDTDFNADGRVDWADFELLQACALGPEVPPPPDCLPTSP